jgi:hypothetical protein
MRSASPALRDRPPPLNTPKLAHKGKQSNKKKKQNKTKQNKRHARKAVDFCEAAWWRRK